jgi:hypothetical protein
MQGRVKYMGSAPADAPKPSKMAVIDGSGQDSVLRPWTEMATPNTAKGISVTGKKRGMGAAIRGGRYTYD